MKDITTLTSQNIEQRGLLTHEPKWLRDQRVNAWEDFQSCAEPNWKKLKIPKVDIASATQLNFPSEEIRILRMEKKPPQDSSGKITLHDGKVLRISLLPELAHQGVIFCDMQTAVLERADLIDAYIKESHWGIKDKLSSLHKALWENGYFLFIPKGVVVEKPFQIQVIQNTAGQSIANRNLVILDERSQAIVEESFESEVSQDSTTINASTTEVFANEASYLQYLSNQNWGEQIYDCSYRRLHADKNATITALFTLIGAQAGRVVITGEASQPGARIEHDAIIVGTKQQRFKIIAEMDHAAQQTEGLMRYKGILKDEAYSYLDGLIRVQSRAQKTQSRLEEHTLLLSDNARCDAVPALDIQTDDVQVSHSASVTQADAEKLFYLMSRGLSKEDARALIVQGFFENLLALIKRPEWYDQTKALIEAKLIAS